MGFGGWVRDFWRRVMSDVQVELERLEGWIGSLMQSLTPARRARAAGMMGRMVRGNQAKRIAAQRNPDGSAFEKRKPKSEQKRINRALKFLYPSGGSGEPRTVLLKSWTKDGPLFTGYDVEALGIRSFEKRKIIKWLPVPPEEQNRGAGRGPRRRSIKSRIMFRKLRRFSRMKLQTSAEGVSVGFSGQDGAIADVHQRGGYDRVVKNGPRIRYAQRRLLGLTAQEESQLLDIMDQMIEAEA